MYKLYLEQFSYDSSGLPHTNVELVYKSGSESDKYRIINPRFSMEVGCAGELTITVDPNDNLWQNTEENMQFSHDGNFNILTTSCYLFYDDECLWRGRLKDKQQNFFAQHEITFVGDLDRLNDVSAQDYSYGYGQGQRFHNDVRRSESPIPPLTIYNNFLSMYNEMVPSVARIRPGNVNFKNKGVDRYLSNNDFNTVLESLVDYFGNDGYFCIRYDVQTDANGFPSNTNMYLDYNQFEDMKIRTSQAVRFGENLIDLSEVIRSDDIFSVIVPLGAYTTDYKCSICNRFVNVTKEGVKKATLWAHIVQHGATQGKTSPNEDIINDIFTDSQQGSRLTIESVYHAGDHPRCAYPYPTQNTIRNDDLFKAYGYVEKVVVFEDIEDADRLLTAAIARRNLVNMFDSIEVTAYDLRHIGYVVDDIWIGDMGVVDSTPHGIYKNMMCTKVELDLEDPSNNSYNFGSTAKGLSEMQVENRKQANKSQKQIRDLNVKLANI